MGNIRVKIENYQEKYRIEEELLRMIKNAVRLCILDTGFEKHCLVDISLVDDEKIKELNTAYRGKNKATDVLSFPLLEIYEGKYKETIGDINLDTEEFLLGDIVISVPMAVKQSNEYGHSLRRELIFLVIHGTLHLLGYDHEEKRLEKNMFKKQKKILKKLDFKKHERMRKWDKI